MNLIGKFSMLEQYLPGSLEHPFAQTMLKHFEKLRSPLKAAIEFSSLQNQRSRFTEYPAWADVQALNLWQLWSQDCLLSPSDRAQLDHVEPFDEWEEFALFASHYFLLVAQTASASKIVLDYPVTEHEQLSGQKSSCTAPIPFSSTYNENPNQLGQRRFGASLKVNHDHVLHVAGHSSSPLKTCDHYLVPSNDDEEEAAQPHIQVQNLLLGMNVMCPSITHIGNGNKLFVGGRVSPDHASARCFACDDNQAWREVQSLPHGLYRHSSVQVDDSMVLIFGGKCNGWEISAEWLYWHRKHGWQSIEIGGERAEPRFGASIICVRTSQAISQGYLTGGIGRHGVVLTDFWHWKFYPSTSSNKARLELTDLTVRFQGNKHESQLGRFGAQMIYSGSEIYLIGGVTRHGLVQQDCEIMVIRPEAGQIQATDCHPGPRPLLIGFSAEPLTENAFVIVGGAATCFSFGTYWNRGCYTFCDKVNQAGSERRGYQLATSASLDSPKKASLGTPLPGFMTNKTKEHTQIKRMKISSESDFSRIMEVNLPTVLWGLDFGSCIEKWNDSYLEEQIGVERLVTVHSAQSNKMDFVAKNFTYDRMTFGKFLKDIAIGEKKYLRAVSADKPAEMVTTLSKDFPELANDFQLPPALAFVTANSHSSPLRISGPVKMWLHYDVMANVLCQIRGSKRLILYHPRDVTALGFAPGSSSSQFDPFEADSLGTTNSRSKISSYEAHLRPGDVLFIPPLWPHTAQPIGTTSVAVNVFFKNMDTGYAAGRDTYGNRDLQAYENGRRDIQKILKAQRTLPKDAAIFYLQRLAAELSDAAAALDTAAP